ncbi:MAG: hypothetical protein CO113_10020 [Elusimicrobia bacterium CG_4_9_14_3_um_filter_62_55]|nr:MAG: hypothetical protein COR54_07650 [Elusimicrobia bacterium CG22_combo_CG10-13_8_21_14_all_63_91]PJA13202.1 MAG: hypothetical protein COX66_15540 [Elusimicrobia bacterium CG_4_10_14_0_2_um_filter_63_34]PJB25173.1 MAG: hypothetical protein CO113_10020 [Elusimicrobia bacterium CG_4_9_14_3_um_filter_62_55]
MWSRLGRAWEAVSLRLPAAAGALTLALALTARVAEPGWVERIRLSAFDLLITLEPRPPSPDSPVRIVLVDEESLSRVGPWPWPRTVHAALLERLAAGGSRAVALDFVFPRADRSSPAALVAALPPLPGVRRLAERAAALPDHDALFARALRRLPVALGFAFGAGPAPPPRKAGFGVLGPDPAQFLPDAGQAVVSIPALSVAAAGAGAFSVFPEPDGVVRRIPLLFASGSGLYPSLVLEALRLYFGEAGYQVRAVGGRSKSVEWVRVGPRFIPTGAEGRAWVHYSRAPNTVPAWRVLEGAAAPEGFKDALVFVGAAATLLKDNVATPLGAATPGVVAHAELAAQVLDGRVLSRPDWAPGLELLYMLGLGAGMVLLLPRLGAAACAGVGLGACVIVFPLSWFAFHHAGWLLDPLTPSAAAAAVYAVVSAAAYWGSEAQRRRLEVLDAVKDELIATVSHDLRGPVNAMLMVTDAIRMGVYGPVTEKQVQNLDLLQASGHRLTHFVSNILDAAKIKAGRMELLKQPLKAEELLPSIADLFGLSARAKGVRLEVSLEPGLPAVLADREKIEQVINNLLGNALKFTPSGGVVTLSAFSDGGVVQFAVSDTGYGIAAEDVPKLFRKFAQVDLAKQRETAIKGTGLGLSICKEVVDAHGGKIWVKSEKDKGSSFLFTLPVATA